MGNSAKKRRVIQKFLLLFFTITILFGLLFRGFNLTWGSPYFFHPDERNIASSVSQLRYPSQMNPHFFAYGTFPIYLTYFTGVSENFISNILLHTQDNYFIVDFEKAIIIGRSFSLVLSVLLLILIYHTTKLVGSRKSAILSTSLASLSIGLIQYAHFSTFEMWLSTLTLLLCYQILLQLRHFSKSGLVNISFVVGLLISIKISSLIFIPLVMLFLLFQGFLNLRKSKITFIGIEKLILSCFLFLSLVTVVVLITSPYYWLSSSEFLSSMSYESEVALGTLPVFYTQAFQNTKPVIYQFLHVYPFLLNPFILISLVVLPFFLIKRFSKKLSSSYLLISLFLVVTFFSQAFLFVKWMRYYIPTLSFIYVLMGLMLGKLIDTNRKRWAIISVLLIFLSFIFAYAYFTVALVGKDSRITASNWASQNISRDNNILSEVYDLGIVPFNSSFEKNIVLFNFYDLETEPGKQEELFSLTSRSNYVILASQRILQTRLNDRKRFPKGYVFYTSLFSTSEYKLVYKTPCSMLCKILYLGDTMNRYEQTSNVFDRPEVYIFKHVN